MCYFVISQNIVILQIHQVFKANKIMILCILYQIKVYVNSEHIVCVHIAALFYRGVLKHEMEFFVGLWRNRKWRNTVVIYNTKL